MAYKFFLCLIVLILLCPGISPGGGGGGGHSGTQGGRTLVTYFAEEGVFFEDLRMSAIL